uniref:Uncharacterized protein n=1 Tax=Sus scrofa TaxID=9823 RepID=A0A8D1JN01_PIG
MAGQVKDREAFQRLSFLYQAAHCVLAQDPENQALARFYCHTERTIAKRLVLRRDPSVKRTLCRGCSSLLIPGLTCTQRQRRCKGQRWTVQTCLTCQRSQRFLNDPRHLLWGDRPEAQLGSQTAPSTSGDLSTMVEQEGLEYWNPKTMSLQSLSLKVGTFHFPFPSQSCLPSLPHPRPSYSLCDPSSFLRDLALSSCCYPDACYREESQSSHFLKASPP